MYVRTRVCLGLMLAVVVVSLVMSPLVGRSTAMAESDDLWSWVNRVFAYEAPRRARYPSLARSQAGELVVLFTHVTEEQEAAGRGDIMMIRSADEGESWSAPTKIYQAETGEPRTMGTLIATVGVSILLISLPAGALSERWGRKKLSLLAFAMTGTGMVLFALSDNLRGIWGAGGLLGLGLGIFSSVNWAWATDLVPATEAGKYLGLSNLATVGAALTSRLFGPVVDLINARFSNAGYSLVFLLTAVGAILGIIMTLKVPETRLDAHMSPVSAAPS